MTTKFLRYVFIFDALLIAFFYLKLVICNFGGSDSPEALTRRTLWHYDVGVGLILAKGDASLSTRLNRYRDVELISALRELIANDENLEAVSKNLSKIDAWGNQYNVEWRTNIVSIVSPMLLKNENELLIWSSGANGINEYGNGDDIYEGEDWTIYK